MIIYLFTSRIDNEMTKCGYKLLRVQILIIIIIIMIILIITSSKSLGTEEGNFRGSVWLTKTRMPA